MKVRTALFSHPSVGEGIAEEEWACSFHSGADTEGGQSSLINLQYMSFGCAWRVLWRGWLIVMEQGSVQQKTS